MRITEMTISDYDAFMDLMRRTPEMQVREADSREAIEKYLLRNPGLSLLAWDGEKLVACAMCGHDGRRGYLQHVIADPDYRGRGIAHELVTRSLDHLEGLGILKTHIDVLVTNIAILTIDRRIPMREEALTGAVPRARQGWTSRPIPLR